MLFIRFVSQRPLNSEYQEQENVPFVMHLWSSRYPGRTRNSGNGANQLEEMAHGKITCWTETEWWCFDRLAPRQCSDKILYLKKKKIRSNTGSICFGTADDRCWLSSSEPAVSCLPRVRRVLVIRPGDLPFRAVTTVATHREAGKKWAAETPVSCLNILSLLTMANPLEEKPVETEICRARNDEQLVVMNAYTFQRFNMTCD